MNALLNDEGKKQWGEIFPDGHVPVQTLIAQDATVEETNQPLKVYLVNWILLSKDQQQAILKKLSDKFHAPKEAIEKDILKKGLPLQSKYVSCVSIPAEFF